VRLDAGMGQQLPVHHRGLARGQVAADHVDGQAGLGLLVDLVRERQPGLDYKSLKDLAYHGAEQEVWALLCAYHAIREVICAAAALARQDPLRISFANALDVVRGPVGSPGSFSPSPG